MWRESSKREPASFLWHLMTGQEEWAQIKTHEIQSECKPAVSWSNSAKNERSNSCFCLKRRILTNFCSSLSDCCYQGYLKVFLIYWKSLSTVYGVNHWGTVSNHVASRIDMLGSEERSTTGPLQDMSSTGAIYHFIHPTVLICNLNLTVFKTSILPSKLLLFSVFGWILGRVVLWLGFFSPLICFQYKLEAQSGFTVSRDQSKYKYTV